MKIEVTHQDMYDKGFREGYGKTMYEVEQKQQHCKTCVYYQYDQFEKRYFCIHPKIETDDSYAWSALAMDPDDQCSCYEKRTKKTCLYCKNRNVVCSTYNGYCNNYNEGE